MVALISFLLQVTVAYLGVFVPLWMQEKKQFTPVMASALPVLLMALVFYPLYELMPEAYNKVLSIFMGATFVGMAHPKKINTNIKKLIVSLLYTIGFLYLIPNFVGFGGALGATAGLVMVSFIWLVDGLLYRKNKN